MGGFGLWCGDLGVERKGVVGKGAGWIFEIAGRGREICARIYGKGGVIGIEVKEESGSESVGV